MTTTNYRIGSRDEERETKERRRLLKEKMDRIRFLPVCSSLISVLFDFGKHISDTSKVLWFQRSSSSSCSWTPISTNVRSCNNQSFKFHLRDRNRARNAIEIWKEFVQVSSLHPKNKNENLVCFWLWMIAFAGEKTAGIHSHWEKDEELHRALEGQGKMVDFLRFGQNKKLRKI